MLSKEVITAGNREQVEILDSFGAWKNVEAYECDRGSRKFSVGDRLELFGMKDYPEFDGEIVTITGYRESDRDLNGYYIKSDSGELEPFLNFVWEKRLRVISNA